MGKGYIDFDGIIVDSVAVICHILSKRDGVYYNPSLVKKWDMMDIIPYADSRLITDIFDSDEFWEIADDFIMDGVKELIKKHREHIIICSIGGIKNQVNKLKFIKKHFGDIDCLPVVTNMSVHPKSVDKTYIKMGYGDWYLEDSANNLRASNADFKILFNNHLNFDAEWSASPKDREFDCYATNFTKVDTVVSKFIKNNR